MPKSLQDTPAQELQREGIESSDLSKKGDDTALKSTVIQWTYFTVTGEGRGGGLEFHMSPTGGWWSVPFVLDMARSCFCFQFFRHPSIFPKETLYPSLS